jgi:hypothetical protein
MADNKYETGKYLEFMLHKTKHSLNIQTGIEPETHTKKQNSHCCSPCLSVMSKYDESNITTLSPT